ncbi:metallophosphoesterase family protein [Luteimicrobium sp. DT211]|uniref:metallophosphoesterase family protein n=1 Tax=Luteimicrobium sp. DT211 TaxID=3393412 RepID=UPI003CF52221
MPDTTAPPARSPWVPPRWLRWTVGVVLAVVACAAWGVTTASAELSLGPHEARYEVTTNGLVVVDLGPLGTVQLDSPAPLGLGARVVVKEIPAELTSITPAQNLDALGTDVQSYLQFFATPDITVHRAVRALAVDAAWRTLAALAVVALAVTALVLLLGRARRRELAAVAGRHTWELTAGVVVLVATALTLSSSQPDTSTTTAEDGSPLFAGTPLAGARITGRLAGVVNTYGQQLVTAYQSSEGFYAKADRSLEAAWDERDVAQAAEDALAGAGVGPAPTTSPSTPTAGSDATTPSPSPTASSDVLTLLVISDLHCNTGMSPLIRTAVERSGAQVVLNAGDTTINGTAVEQVCVDSFASAIPKKIPTVMANGNHDSPLVAKFAQDAGWTVLDGSVVDVKGLRILGDHDVLQTRIGVASHQSGDVSPDEQAQALAGAACDAEKDGEPGVDLLLIHDPSIGTVPMQTGCVPAQVSGHLHRRIDPTQIGLGIRYVNSSTAGATLGQPTVGPLRGTAEMTVLRFDRQTHRFMDWQLVSVTKKGVASVSERQPWPEPTAVEVPASPLPPGD